MPRCEEGICDRIQSTVDYVFETSRILEGKQEDIECRVSTASTPCLLDCFNGLFFLPSFIHVEGLFQIDGGLV
jgi:hypothetical protein